MTQYPFKLDEWADEQIDVPTFTAKTDKHGNFQGVEQTTTKKTVKTMYSRVPETKLSCATGTHKWFMEDKHKGVAGCKKCIKHRFLRPIYEFIKDGHICDRDTLEILD